MPLAWLLGQDDDPLYGLAAGVVDPRRVSLIGVRSFEPEEEHRLDRLGVRVFHIEEVRNRGLDAVFTDALAIATAGTAGFGISIDLDVVTPEEAPGVGTPAPGGITGPQLARALGRIGGGPTCSRWSSSNTPAPRSDGRSARVAIDALAAALCGPGEQAQVIAHAVQRNDP